MESNRLMEPADRLDAWANAMIGAAIEVHRTLGPGFGEPVYQRALEVELGLRGIPYLRQERILVQYKGIVVGKGVLDFLIDQQLIIEIKAVESVLPLHVAQVISYLKAMNKQLALLINFKVPILKDGIKTNRADAMMSGAYLTAVS